VTGICVLASLLMAALGGCWWPLEIGPPVMKTIALCLPTGWALQALHQLISFGSGFDAVLLPLAVLVGFGAVANLLAARFFRSFLEKLQTLFPATQPGDHGQGHVHSGADS
jgi:ABC-2 type transport system permease protein